MSTYFNFWEFLAGLGLFLYGISLLEKSLTRLAGPSFKKFLRKHTRNPVEGILSGTVATAVLQSSSVVTLMVLALVGSGIISLRNAIGIVMGSNLGTTFTGWIVATLGFKLDFDRFSLPLIGIGCLVIVFMQGREKRHAWGQLAAGFGFLFMGLGFMKTSIEYLAKNFDMSLIADNGLFFFLVFGFVFTAIIQSSSATMMITLSALNAGIIDLPSAGALVIGADLGTTITVVLGALKGTSEKRRVALCHFTFNLATDLVAFALLKPLIFFVGGMMGPDNALMGLVLFHSSFNILGILIFLPFIKQFEAFLETCFVHDEETVTRFIHRTPIVDSELALTALEREVHHLLDKSFYFIIHSLHPRAKYGDPTSFGGMSLSEGYQNLKLLEGAILAYGSSVIQGGLGEPESTRLQQLYLAVRSGVHGAKCLKDVQHNLQAFRGSEKEPIKTLLQQHQALEKTLYTKISELYDEVQPSDRFEELVRLMQLTRDTYLSLPAQIEAWQKGGLSQLEVSTALNVNRELYSGNKGIIMATKDFLLDAKEAQDFNDVP